MTRCLSIITWLVLILSVDSAAVAQEQKPPLQNDYDRVIVVGGDHNYPPYEFINKDGKPDGYNTELTLAIAKVMGLNVRVELEPWSDIRKRLLNGQVDILQGMGYSKERDQLHDFVPHHAIINQSMFARKGQSYPSDFSQLKDKEVIVQRGGFVYDQMVRSNIGTKLIEVGTHVDALRLLSSGKHDYAIVANLPGLYIGKELQLTNIQSGGKPFVSIRYGYSVKEGNDALYALFSEGLAILKRTGKQQEIYNKWLGPLEKKGFPWKTLSLVSGGLLATLLVFFGLTVVWNRQLSQTVARRTKALEKKQNQLLQADKMTSLGVLVSGVAHEINNPTSLLLLNTPVIKESFNDVRSILEKHYKDNGDFDMGGLKYSRMRKEIPYMLDDMIDRAKRIKGIVDELRDFTQQTSPDLTQIVDLNKTVTTVVRIVKQKVQESTDHFSIKLSEQSLNFYGDARRIEQVLINLILNACQALDSRSQEINISTFADPASKSVCLQVGDQGRGIEEAKINRIIEPFYTTKRESGGTGLGMSVSNSIIKEHKGELLIESTLGRGTFVTIKLPAIDEDETANDS